MDGPNLERKVELARIPYSSALLESGTRCIAANDMRLYIGSGAKIITLTKDGKQLSAKIHPAMEIEHIAVDNRTVCSVMNHSFDKKSKISITDAKGNHIHEKEYTGNLGNVALDGTRIYFVLQEEKNSSIIVIDRNGRDIAKRDFEGTAYYIAVDDKHIYTSLNTEEKGILFVLDKEGNEVTRNEHELPVGPINADSQKVFYALVDIKEVARKELEAGITAPPEESLMRRLLRKKESED
jgi:DNA-binding beta-propeller fold protein YncE